MVPNTWRVKSGVNGLRWPGLLDVTASHLMSVLFQWDRSQWWPAERMRESRFAQLCELVRHARATCPYYAQHWDQAGWDAEAPLTPERWLRMPTLRREDLQSRFEEVRSGAPPEAHGPIDEVKTSGSTGQPVRVLNTSVWRLMWLASTARFYLWHGPDITAKMCTIRPSHGPVSDSESVSQNWGSPLGLLFETGPMFGMDCRRDASDLARWLERHDPKYLLTLPSTLEAIAIYCIEHGIRPSTLAMVVAYAEMLKPRVRELVREAWGVPIVDMYSCAEVGCLALQCPEHEHYHAQDEVTYVEILDDEGRPCAPGRTGRVVVTSLHNLATPLIRYELDDYAEPGDPCPCGRGLPVIKKIVGRCRNLITRPDGKRYWPAVYADQIAGIAPFRQFQLIQRTPEQFDARFVMDRELTDEEQAKLTQAFRDSLDYPFRFTYSTQRDRIVSPSGKFETIISDL